MGVHPGPSRMAAKSQLCRRRAAELWTLEPGTSQWWGRMCGIKRWQSEGMSACVQDNQPALDVAHVWMLRLVGAARGGGNAQRTSLASRGIRVAPSRRSDGDAVAAVLTGGDLRQDRDACRGDPSLFSSSALGGASNIPPLATHCKCM